MDNIDIDIDIRVEVKDGQIVTHAPRMLDIHEAEDFIAKLMAAVLELKGQQS